MQVLEKVITNVLGDCNDQDILIITEIAKAMRQTV
jgi:hypothetical protein